MLCDCRDHGRHTDSSVNATTSKYFAIILDDTEQGLLTMSMLLDEGEINNIGFYLGSKSKGQSFKLKSP